LTEFFFDICIISMKKYIIIGLAIIILIGLVVVRSWLVAKNTPVISNSPAASSSPPEKQVPNNTIQNNQAALVAPIGQASGRVTKKPFGIFITPQNSPVQPEKFYGYHTGTDFETFPEEQNNDVPIYAITSGKILLKKWASGYGGVLVESGQINNGSVTIIYGHLNLGSITKNVGDTLDSGEQFSVLGKGYSQETDGERKHLHLGIHKGTGINILGYVNNKSDLGDWIDPMSVIQF